MPQPPPFHLGLVMAGAVSAGAYTAGVLDFLFEALNTWEAEKRLHPRTTPAHRVVVSALSGASAGGICAAMVPMLPALGFFPVSSPDHPDRNRNLLYRSWVTEMDLLHLLDTGDLAGEGIPSLLNGQPLAEIANRAVTAALAALENPTAIQWPDWLAAGLRVFLSLTNTRGIPYQVMMQDGQSSRPAAHRMVLHGDMACFVAGPDPVAPDAIMLSCHRPDPASWHQLGQAALATSAFPLGLPARMFRQPARLYQADWWLQVQGLQDAKAQGLIDTENGYYPFHAIDGGVMHNEPLQPVLRHLAGQGATVLIDPFPDGDTAPAKPQTAFSLCDGLTSLFGSLQSQCRFRPRDLLLALDETIHGRYLVAPMRDRQRGQETALAGAGLGGFAGFLHPAFREHDFFLGRRNCQRFLVHHLSTPTGKPLIPLYGACAVPVQVPAWPRVGFRQDIAARIEPAIRQRCRALLRAATGGWVVPRLLDGWLAAKTMAVIRQDLEKRNLLR